MFCILRMMLCLAWLSFQLFSPLSAAEIKRVGGSVYLSGDIEAADVQRLAGQTEDIFDYSHLLFLDSGGGDFSAAIKLAAYVRQRNFTTIVESTSRCLSACALVFLGGGNDYDGALRFLEIGGSIGFHSPYTKDKQSVPDAAADSFSRSVIESTKQILDLFETFGLNAGLTSELMPNRPDQAFKYIDDLDWVWKLGITLVTKDTTQPGTLGETYKVRQFYNPTKTSKSMAVNLCRNSAAKESSSVADNEDLETSTFIEMKDRVFFPGAINTAYVADGPPAALWCLVFDDGHCYRTENESTTVWPLAVLTALSKVERDYPPDKTENWTWTPCGDNSAISWELMVPRSTKLSAIDSALKQYEATEPPVGQIWKQQAIKKMEWKISNSGGETQSFRIISYSRVAAYGDRFSLQARNMTTAKLSCRSDELLCLHTTGRVSCNSGSKLSENTCCQFCSIDQVSSDVE